MTNQEFVPQDEARPSIARNRMVTPGRQLQRMDGGRIGGISLSRAVDLRDKLDMDKCDGQIEVISLVPFSQLCFSSRLVAFCRLVDHL